MFVKIPDKYLSKVGPDVQMDITLVDVKLKDGTVWNNLVVRGGVYITGLESDIKEEGDLGFKSEDIVNLRSSSLLKRILHIW